MYSARPCIIIAMQYAKEENANGVRIANHKASNDPKDLQCHKFNGRPLLWAFNSDYPAIEYDNLLPVENGEIRLNLHIVTFESTRYLHKFMRPKSYQENFEREVRNYTQLKGCDGVLRLEAVVKRDGAVQGLLIPYIGGDNLWDTAIKSESELLNITYRILKDCGELRKG
jgi:hypothetical protein